MRLHAKASSAFTHGRIGLIALALATALLLSLIHATGASAGKIVDRYFPANGASGGAGGSFNTPRGIAVNDPAVSDGNGTDGWRYVADDANHRVQAFDATGAFKWAIGRDVIKTSPAVNTDLGDVFEKCTHAADCKAGSAGTTTDGPAGELDNPQGVAIDQVNGHIYVRDRDNRRVQEFTAAGGFVRMWGQDVIVAAGPPANSNGTGFEVCDVTNGNILADCKQGTTGDAAGQIATSSQAGNGIAIDPLTRDVFVVDPGNKRLQQFNPQAAPATSTFVRAFGYGVDSGTTAVPNGFEICTMATSCQGGTNPNGAQPGEYTSNRPNYVAVDSRGIVYSDDASNERIFRFDSTIAGDDDVAATQLLLSDLVLAYGPIGLEVDPDSDGAGDVDIDRLYVARSAAAGIEEYDISTSDPPTGADLVDTHMIGSGLTQLGIAHNASADSGSGELYVTSNSSSHRVYVLDSNGIDEPIPMTIDTPTGVTAHEASFSGSVNPAGFPTSYRFEYSKTGAEGSWSAVAAYVALGEGVTPVNVPVLPAQGAASGLDANSLYFVRVAAMRGFGNTPRYSDTLSFTTDPAPPLATTLATPGPSDQGAYLVGSVHAQGSPTTYWFELGETDSYGTNLPDPAASAGSGSVAQTFAELASDLSPETTYHYRVCADNAHTPEPVCGADQAFTTLPLRDSGPSGRAYEMVTPPDKFAGGGVGMFGANSGLDGEVGLLSGVPSSGGNRTLVAAGYGATMSPGGGSFAVDHAFSERDPDTGWLTESAYGRINFSERQGAPFLSPIAANPSLSHTAWKPSLDGAMLLPGMSAAFPHADAEAYWQFNYLRDASGRWELVSPTAADQGKCCNNGNSPPAAISADGSTSAVGTLSRGMLGEADPSWDFPASPGGIRNGVYTTYAIDHSEGLSDTFPPTNPRELLGTCDAGTLIPTIDDNGTDAGPPGSFSSLGSWSAGNPVVTIELNVISAPLVGHTIFTGAGLVGSKVTAVTGAGVEVDPPPSAGGGPFGSITGGQDSAAAADDTVEPGSCPPPVEYEPGEQRSHSVVSSRGSTIGDSSDVAGSASRSRIVSRDGSRIFFMSPDPRNPGTTPPLPAPPASGCTGSGEDLLCPTQVFVRQKDDNGGVATRWVSAPEVDGQAPGLLATAGYEGASAEGDRVFFTTNSPLTSDDPNGQALTPTDPRPILAGTANANSWDLYMYELGDGDDPTDGGALTRVSRGPLGNGDCNVVQGSINPNGALRFVSEDGTRLYFTCNAALPGVSGSTNGTTTTQGGAANQSATGTTNLYMYENDGFAESWTFVSRIPRETSSPSSGGSSATTALCASSSAVSGQPRATSTSGNEPSYLLVKANCVRGTADASFITFWTPGSLVAADPDNGVADMYGFDAEADELTRLSTPQGGPGGAYACRGTLAAPSERCHADPGFESRGAFNYIQIASHIGVFADPENTGERVAYFESRSRLVPEDDDLTMDVYEWRDGVLSLLTPGVEGGAFYSGNSADAESVFFVTGDVLTWNDIDALRDLYVARVGGGFAPPPPPPPCVRDPR